MKSVRKSVLIWYSAEQMYALVTDVARYQDFLPWCSHSRVLSEGDNEMTAEVGIGFKGVRQSFVTRNQHVPGREVCMRLVEGPFSNLEGDWTFTPVGAEGNQACRVELQLDYGFSSGLLAKVIGPVFDRIANSLVDAFITRAEQVYGSA